MTDKNTPAVDSIPEILDFPGHVTLLERSVEDVHDEGELNQIALSAMFDFMSKFCHPLSFDLLVSYWNDDLDCPVTNRWPVSPYRILETDLSSHRNAASPIWDNPEILNIEIIDYPTVLKFCSDATKTSPLEPKISFEEMRIRSTMAEVPPQFAPESGDQIVARNHWGRVISYPIESLDGRRWISGPHGVILNAPIELRISRDPGLLSLEIFTFWSIWTPGSAGFSEITKGIRALMAEGWLPSDSSLD